MTTLTILFLVFSGLSTLAIAFLWGCMVGMRVNCEIWAPPKSYDNLYGPEGTIQPGWFETKLFKLMRRP